MIIKRPSLTTTVHHISKATTEATGRQTAFKLDRSRRGVQRISEAGSENPHGCAVSAIK